MHPLSIMSKCDYLDLVELIHHKRKACRITVTDGNIVPVLEYITAHNLHYGVSPYDGSPADIYGSPLQTYPYIAEYEVFAAHDSKTVEQIMMASSAPDEHEFIGGMYGYPECCIAAFTENSHRSSNAQFPLLATALNTNLTHFPKIMTPDRSHTIMSIFPCAFDCTYAVNIAKFRAAYLEQHHGIAIPATTFAGLSFDAEINQ